MFMNILIRKQSSLEPKGIDCVTIWLNLNFKLCVTAVYLSK